MPRRPKLGQHFLVDHRVAERILGHARLRGDETVLEVGPGKGALTRLLAERAGRVVAVEKDPELVDLLLDEGLPGNVELLAGDVLKTDLPPFDKVVANIPYRISSNLTFRLLDTPFEEGVLMYQREFAERLSSPVGSPDYGRLSVNAAVKAETEVLEIVPASAFRPRPRVASALVRLKPRRAPPFPIPDVHLFEEVVRAGFQHRRKTMRNALLDQWRVFTASREALLGQVEGLPHMDRRPETLGPEEFNDVAVGLRRALGPGWARSARGA